MVGAIRCDQREDSLELLKFQKDFIDQALRPDISIAAMSISRGNGKSYAGRLAGRSDHGPNGFDVQGGFRECPSCRQH